MKTGVMVNTEIKQTSSVVREFSRFAHQYDEYNMIQAQVAKQLVESLASNAYHSVIDIGCGSGAIFHNFKKQHISVEQFIAVDSAQTMLDRHPTETSIIKICSNFNEDNFLGTTLKTKMDLCISASALQWSEDLDFTMKRMSELSNTFHAAIFTSGTFRTLHLTAGVFSPIYDIETIQKTVQMYFKSVKFKVHQYKLEFPDTREMFKYIKQSGVSGGERQLSYTQMKQLMLNYPLDYLEFEVLFVEGKM